MMHIWSVKHRKLILYHLLCLLSLSNPIFCNILSEEKGADPTSYLLLLSFRMRPRKALGVQ